MCVDMYDLNSVAVLVVVHTGFDIPVIVINVVVITSSSTIVIFLATNGSSSL